MYRPFVIWASVSGELKKQENTYPPRGEWTTAVIYTGSSSINEN